jgi:hypothetical protein
LTGVCTGISIQTMTRVRRITANLPDDVLRDAMAVTGQGITETIVTGLRLVRRSRAYERAMALKGKLHLDVDLATSRERRRR